MAVARSGTMLRFSSNLTSPSNMFCEISVSVSASAIAGSRVPKSERIGKDSVWFGAKVLPVFPPPPPHATSTRLVTPPIARALRIRIEVGVIAFPYQSLRREPLPPRLLPGVFAGPPGRERADEGWRTERRPLLPPTLWLGRR